jgi:polysaccharide pyruvyl transferase WcaK-like protein
MKVAVCGFYGKSNFGDDLMADCLGDRLSCGAHQVTHYSDNSAGDIRNGLRDLSYLDADVVVVGGGNIIGPGFWAFKDGGIDRLGGVRRLLFLNVGVTPDYLSDKEFAGKLAGLNATWRVRDAESVELLARIGIEAQYLPDISFTLGGKRAEKADKTIAVFLNDYPFGDLHKDASVERFLRATSAAKLVAHHLDWMADFGWRVRFVPCHVSNAVDDRLPGASVYGWMRRRDAAEMAMAPLGWREVFREISDAGLVVSMRYHASTCALVSGSPLVDLTHHAKNQRLMRSLGAEKCSVNVWGCTHEDLIRATQEAERFGPGAGMTLKDEADRLWRLFDAEWRELTLGGDQET